MSMLVRPYPVSRLEAAAAALSAAQGGDLALLQELYVFARDQLEDLDPDEVREPVLAHTEAGHRDKVALRAAIDVADAWEGVVAIAGTIAPLPRFRGFLWTCAWRRYLDTEGPDLSRFKRWCRGELLPDLGPEDTVLYAALPALVGMGPELPDELPGPAPVEGRPVFEILGLPDEDWEGADPIDGIAIDADTCAGAISGASGAWKDALSRGARQGLLIRPA